MLCAVHSGAGVEHCLLRQPLARNPGKTQVMIRPCARQAPSSSYLEMCQDEGASLQQGMNFACAEERV